MNNGNFFPNFNTNGPQNNEMNLNLQTAPGTPPAVEITPMTYTPQQEKEEIPQVMSTQVQQPLEQKQISENTTDALSVNNIQPIMPVQNNQSVEISQQSTIPEPVTMNTNIEDQLQPDINDTNEIPLFSVQNNTQTEDFSQINQPIEKGTQIPESINNQEQTNIEEPLLFPENNNFIQNNQAEDNYDDEEDDDDEDEDDYDEEDDETEEDYGDIRLNKYYQVKRFLEENNIKYKAYTNEKNNCIIIEF